MKEKQEKIFFIGGNGLEEAKSSPNVEVISKGYEFLYLIEQVDEHWVQALLEFDGKKFQDAAKEGLESDTLSEAEKQIDERKEEFEPSTEITVNTDEGGLPEGFIRGTPLYNPLPSQLEDKYAEVDSMSIISGFEGNAGRFVPNKISESRSNPNLTGFGSK